MRAITFAFAILAFNPFPTSYLKDLAGHKNEVVTVNSTEVIRPKGRRNTFERASIGLATAAACRPNLLVRTPGKILGNAVGALLRRNVSESQLQGNTQFEDLIDMNVDDEGFDTAPNTSPNTFLESDRPVPPPPPSEAPADDIDTRERVSVDSAVGASSMVETPIILQP